MIKNLIFDIGGIIIDDGKEIMQKYFNISKEETVKLRKIIYGSNYFSECLLGKITQNECKQKLILENPSYKYYIEKSLNVDNQNEILPMKKEVLDLIYTLKNKYKIYFLSNLTDATYEYIIKILNEFNGGIYSFKVGVKKPDSRIYEKLIKKYKLEKKECIFFDDKQKNIDMSNKLGILGIKFNTKEDIINSLNKIDDITRI